MNIELERVKQAWRDTNDDGKELLQSLFPNVDFTPKLIYSIGDYVSVQFKVLVACTHQDEARPYHLKSNCGATIWVSEKDIKGYYPFL